MAADVLHDRLVVGDASGEQDALHVALERRGHGPDLLRDVVTHGFKHLPGPLVTPVDAFHDLNDRVGSQVCDQSSLAGDEFQQFLPGVFPREAGLDQFACRDASRAVRGEGPVPVEGVVHVDDPSPAVCGDRYAASHVGDDQVGLFVGEPRACAVQARRRLLVQGVEDRLALAHRHAGDARRVVHFVDHRGIGDVGLHLGHVGDLCGEEPPEVAGVFHPRVAQVVAHPGVDLVDARGDGVYEPPAADDGRKVLEFELLFAERREDQPAAPVELVEDVRVFGEFFGGVPQRQIQQRPLLIVESDLCGCRAGIYCQDLVTHKFLGSFGVTVWIRPSGLFDGQAGQGDRV